VGVFHRSLELAKASWAVLRKDKELALLPVLSFAAWVIIAATFLLPIVAVNADRPEGDSWTSNPLTWMIAFAGYLVVTYVMIFFNAAIVCGADERLRGGDPTLASALRAARERAGVLLPWAVLSATVTLILKAIEQRAGIIGRIVVGLIGIAWSLVTFLVVPILVVERIGVGAAVKRSGELFKRTWGENVVTNGGIGLLTFLAALLGLLVVLPLLMVGGAVTVAGIVIGVAWVAVVSCVMSTLSGIVQIALYRYAVDGDVSGFGTDQLRGAFRDRRGGFFTSR
jgi:Family of unknown function (DUF6159)